MQQVHCNLKQNTIDTRVPDHKMSLAEDTSAPRGLEVLKEIGLVSVPIVLEVCQSVELSSKALSMVVVRL